MKYEAKLRPAFDGQTEWTEQAVAGLVGQTPATHGFGSDTATITAARIEDGWVIVTLDDGAQHDDLAAWLTQIWDGQEATARAATEGPWKWQAVAPPHKYALVGKGGRMVVPSRTPDVWPSVSDATFMEANDPASVLARIAADRQILADYLDACRSYEIERTPFREGQRFGLLMALARIAETHADRPGYQEAWRP